MLKLNGLLSLIILSTFFTPFHLNAEIRGQYFESSDLTVGSNHVCAVTSGGVKCFGNAEAVTTKIPTTLKTVTQLQAGNRFSCGLTDKGVRCWGEIPGTTKKDLLIGQRELKEPRLLAVGYDHACAVGKNNKIKCWGKNEMGEGTPPEGLTNITELSLGMTNSCAIADKKIICWGIKNTGSTEVPENLTNPRNLTSGWWHHCVETDEGAKCWGHPYNETVNPDDPTISGVVSGGLLNCAMSSTGVKCWDETGKTSLLEGSESTKKLKMGSSLICAITDEHGIMCWKQRSEGFKKMMSFVPSGGIANIEKIAAGNANTCVYGDNEEVKCWGNNPDGSLDIPTQIPGPLSAFSLGARRLCTISKEGPKCFGGQRIDFDVPKNLGDVSMISSGGYQICAASKSKLSCWGDDIRDALQVPSSLTNISMISSGFTHACASANNEVTCWGGSGLIRGVNPDKKMKNPRAICAGGTFSCGIDEWGKVSCWGSKISFSSEMGKELFGMDTKAVLKVPRKISDAVEISCGLSHACAIYKGQINCWGDRGLTGTKLSPKVAVKNPRMLTAGWNHTCAMGDNGLACWGDELNLEMPKYSLEK